MREAPVEPDHWLLRLTAEDWMRAGVVEYDRGVEALAARNARQASVHAVRAAGMGINALLRDTPDERYGRSYAEHLTAVAAVVDAPVAVKHAARVLISDQANGLVTLGGRQQGPLAAARAILVWCAERLPEVG
ncbi:MAG: hypothetical protein RL199_1513 [Pseudomonadota bacterium]|jgi:hypothetical protein